MHEGGVAHCLIKVSVEKVALPYDFVPMPPAFYHSCSPTIQYHLGPSLRPSSMYFSTTQDNRDQALRKTYSENFLSSLGMFLASPPHVSKNREPKPTLSHSKLALPQSTSMFPTPPTSRDVLLQRAMRRGAGWMLSPFPMILAYAFCSCILHGSFQLWYNVCAGAPSYIAEGREGKGRGCKDLVFKLIWLIFAWIEECSYEQPGWLDVMSSCGTFRAALQLQKDVSGVPR